MNLFYSLWFMMFGSFIIQIIIMSLIMTNSFINITFSVGKFYISIIMSLLMGILEVFMYDLHMSQISITYYFTLLFFLIIFIYLYRNQIYVTDEEFLNEMIEHHSMAILTSEEILQKEPSQKVAKLAQNIISTQQAEINYMKQLINYQ